MGAYYRIHPLEPQGRAAVIVKFHAVPIPILLFRRKQKPPVKVPQLVDFSVKHLHPGDEGRQRIQIDADRVAAECGGLEHGDTAAAEAVEDNIPLAGVVLNHMSEDVVGTPRKILVHFVLRRVSLGFD